MPINATREHDGNVPMPELMEQLKQICSNLFQCPLAELAADMPLSALGLDSLNVIILANEIQMLFKVDFPLELMTQDPSLTELAQIIAYRRANSAIL